MQEVDQDPFICSDYGPLPDDLSEFMNEDFLPKIIDPDVLFNDLNCTDDISSFGLSLTDTTSEVSGPDHRPQEDKHQPRRGSRSQQSTDDIQPPSAKRQRAEGGDAGPEWSPVETMCPPAHPQGIYRLQPPLQFITVPKPIGYQVVRALSVGPLLSLPNAAAAPTYILVPAHSLPGKQQLPPLSPVNGAVAPVQMCSPPPGSLSDTTSKTISPMWASPVSSSDDGVKLYLQEVKDHINRVCEEMQTGESLSSHYEDVQVIQREILCPGKTSNKCLNKELVIIGDTDRQKNLLRPNQIFDNRNGQKPNKYIVLFGKAGMGKTTLIKKLCRDWSRDAFPQFDFIFLLDDPALMSTEPIHSLQTLLLSLSSLAPSCRSSEAAYAQILTAPRRVLIIFDGFKELRDYETLLQPQEKELTTLLQRDSKAEMYTVRQLYSAILQRVLLPGCTLLLATRPTGIASQLLRRVDSFLEVCGFTPAHIESYFSKYFTDPILRASAVDCMDHCKYLRLLCGNPGLCRLVCLVLEQTKSLEDLPKSLTALCHQVLCLKIVRDSQNSNLHHESQTTQQTGEETQIPISSGTPGWRRRSKSTQTKSRAQVRNRCHSKRANRTKQEKEETEELESVGDDDGAEQAELLSQMCSLAWEGVKANSSIVSTQCSLPAKLKTFGLRTHLFLTHRVITRPTLFSDTNEEGGGAAREEVERGHRGERRKERRDGDNGETQVVLWASPFLQSYLAAVHLSLSRTVSERTFVQTLTLQSDPKGRRRPQREELELTQKFAMGLLFHDSTELRRLYSHTQGRFKCVDISKQNSITKYLEGLPHVDLSPAQVLKTCHYVYEAAFTPSRSSTDSEGTRLAAGLAMKLPDFQTFHEVSLDMSDMFAVQSILERGQTEGRCFSLDLSDSGLQISGLRSLVGLSFISSYRACIADVITLWEQLEHENERELLQEVVFKLKIHPLRATQVCHIEHLAKLVSIHTHRKLSGRPSGYILAQGVPAVKELRKLEFELGPERGPLALPKLWELLPGLHNLQHLDLENSKIGDSGAEKLADALVSLCFLEILNLSQNCIGDQGVKTLSVTLRGLPRLHCLSLYSNVITDEGARSLAVLLPHMGSLTDLDVKYNKLTDVGAQSLAASLRHCKHMRSLRMWNQYIPYGVFERLRLHDARILLQ